MWLALGKQDCVQDKSGHPSCIHMCPSVALLSPQPSMVTHQCHQDPEQMPGCCGITPRVLSLIVPFLPVRHYTQA